MAVGGPAKGISAQTLARGVALAALGLGLAYASFTSAVANVTHRREPATALRFVPNDPMALNAKGTALLNAAEGEQIDFKQMADLAQRSLRQQPFNAAALRLLGLSRAESEDFSAARPAMLLSDRMTRRDMLVQLWLIEEAVSREDVKGALVHYDSVLRTNEESQQLLFPVLTPALEDEALWPSIIPYIQEPAPWLAEFTRYAVRNGNPVSFTRLIRRAGGFPATSVFYGFESELVKRLVDQGSFAEAREFYQTLDGADPAVLTSGQMTAASIEPRFAPISWELYYVGTETDIAFEQAATGEEVELRASLQTSVFAPIARKLVFTTPGRYRFHSEQQLREQGQGARATWEIRCGNASDGRVLWTQNVALNTETAKLDGDVDVPADCPAVTLRLLASAGSGANGVEALFSRTSLTRLP